MPGRAVQVSGWANKSKHCIAKVFVTVHPLSHGTLDVVTGN